MAIQSPNTVTVTNHGLLIQAFGEAIGAVTRWAPRQSQTLTPVYEFGQLTTGGGDDVPAKRGEPYEIVPGNVTGTTLDINRYDIYTKRFEDAFRTLDLTMLSSQASSIKFIEFVASPDGTLSFTDVYYGVWFQTLGKEHSADGNRIVMASATAMFARKRPV